MTTQLVPCRHCGTAGYETSDDPAPGLCPPCLDAGMQRCLEHFRTLVELENVPMRQALHEAYDDLCRIGLTAEATSAFLTSVALKSIGVEVSA